MNEWRDDIGRHLATAQERDNLKAQLAEARAVLREVEWRRQLRRCPSCRAIKPGDGYMGRDPNDLTGHAPDCRLKKAIGET